MNFYFITNTRATSDYGESHIMRFVNSKLVTPDLYFINITCVSIKRAFVHLCIQYPS